MFFTLITTGNERKDRKGLNDYQNGNHSQTPYRQFYTPEPGADLCMRVDQKNVENLDWAAGPSWAAGH